MGYIRRIGSPHAAEVDDGICRFRNSRRGDKRTVGFSDRADNRHIKDNLRIIDGENPNTATKVIGGTVAAPVRLCHLRSTGFHGDRHPFNRGTGTGTVIGSRLHITEHGFGGFCRNNLFQRFRFMTVHRFSRRIQNFG